MELAQLGEAASLAEAQRHRSLAVSSSRPSLPHQCATAGGACPTSLAPADALDCSCGLGAPERKSLTFASGSHMRRPACDPNVPPPRHFRPLVVPPSISPRSVMEI